MALTAEQRRVAARIRQIGRQVGASPKELKAAIQTGLVESGLRNLPGGDADSAGWRQERASLYKDPQNLDASIRRFFQETSAVKSRYGRAGALAAAVQRPAAQYRGRYEERSGEADQILRSLGGGGGVANPDRGMPTESESSAPAVDNSQARKALVAQFLGSPGGDIRDFAMGIRAMRDVPGVTPAAAPRRPTQRPAAGMPSRAGQRPDSNLLELFYDPLGGIKRGQRIGAIGGHSDHVHVASGPKQTQALKKLAQDMGLRVTSEDEGYDGDGVHTSGSYHYKKQAIDVAGSPALMAKYAKAVARRYGTRL